MKKCPHCAKENPQDATFCNSCGAKLQTQRTKPVSKRKKTVATKEKVQESDLEKVSGIGVITANRLRLNGVNHFGALALLLNQGRTGYTE